ncbi:hypothetical protein D3C71_110640 [compost metagenome]
MTWNKKYRSSGRVPYLMYLAIILLFARCEPTEITPKNEGSYCFVSGFGGLGQLYKSSGNTQLDQWHYGEYNNLVQKFGVMPDIYFYTDNNGANAYFTTQVSNNQYPDGTVAIGFNLINKEFTNSPTNSGVSIAIIMAHEFGHCVDAKYNVYSSPSFRSELFADYLAGCYLHLKSMAVGEQYVGEVASSFYAIGDYSFNDPGHHGTPEQRRSCLMAGYNFSKSKVGIGYGLPEAINNARNYVAQF